jgi:hypothetical protein
MDPFCPVKFDLDLSGPPERMQTAIRRLRHDLDQCQACARQRDCPVMQSFNAQVAQAVREVNQELSGVSIAAAVPPDEGKQDV